MVSGIVVGLLLAEQRVSRRHETQLKERGAVAPPGDVYRAMAVVYPTAFVAMFAEGQWRAASLGGAALPVDDGPAWFVSGAVLFVAAKALKYWAIAALGDRWTFRVIIEPGRPLVHIGPYRYLAHPNYVAVVGELVGVALMAGAVVTGPVASAAFGALLWRRVRFEARAHLSANLP